MGKDSGTNLLPEGAQKFADGQAAAWHDRLNAGQSGTSFYRDYHADEDPVVCFATKYRLVNSARAQRRLSALVKEVIAIGAKRLAIAVYPHGAASVCTKLVLLSQTPPEGIDPADIREGDKAKLNEHHDRLIAACRKHGFLHPHANDQELV